MHLTQAAAITNDGFPTGRYIQAQSIFTVNNSPYSYGAFFSQQSSCCDSCEGSDGNKFGRSRSAGRQLAQLALVTTTLGISSELLTLAITLVNTLILRAHRLRRSAASTDLRSVSEVAVDANKV
jgi:hypothetical protein